QKHQQGAVEEGGQSRPERETSKTDDLYEGSTENDVQRYGPHAHSNRDLALSQRIERWRNNARCGIADESDRVEAEGRRRRGRVRRPDWSVFEKELDEGGCRRYKATR